MCLAAWKARKHAGHSIPGLTLDPNLRLPYAQDWNLNVEHVFGNDWLLQLGYVGTKGTKLSRFIEANPTVYDSNLSYTENINLSDQRRLYSGCTVTQPSPCTFSSVGEIAGIANSSYNALQASLKKRFSHGVSALISYTYSKTLDDASTFNITGSASQSVAGENDLAQNPFDVKAEYGRSMFDARHRFVASYQWNLPWFQHPGNWYGHILGNWQVNGITTLMSNTPFTVYDSSNPSAQGSAPEISGFYSSRPNQTRQSEFRHLHQRRGRAFAQLLVQHGCIRAGASGHVWQRGKEYDGRARVSRVGFFGSKDDSDS